MRGLDITTISVEMRDRLIASGERFFVYDSRTKPDEANDGFWAERERFAARYRRETNAFNPSIFTSLRGEARKGRQDTC